MKPVSIFLSTLYDVVHNFGHTLMIRMRYDYFVYFFLVDVMRFCFINVLMYIRILCLDVNLCWLS